MKREKWPIACLLSGDEHEMKSSLLDLILLDSREELDKLAAENNWCRASELTEKFYEYLDEGALDSEDFDDVLRDLFPNEPMRRVDRYTFGDKRQGTFSPGNLEPHMQQALAIAENSRRGICTEVPPEWFDPATLESREDYNDSIIKATYKGIVRYMHDDTLCDELRMLDFEWMEDLDRMEKAIDIAVQGRRSGIADRSHLTLLNESAYQEWRPTDMGRKKGECRICLLDTKGGTFPAPPEYQLPLTAPFGRFAGWRIFNRMRTQISLEDYPFIPFDARYPCIYTITHSIYGRWKAIESAYDWYMDYWDIVAGLRNDLKGRRSISRTLIVDVPQPLVEPEKALQKKCYGIAINQKEKTIELTEDADALAMFRPAVKGLRAFRHR